MNEEASMDQKFLEKVYEAIENNISNEYFGVEQLAHEISISRSQLHRRLNFLTGQSPSQIIKEFRLKKAMEMLQNKVATASEIAYQVGFSSPSYFNRCFNEHFGYPPGKVKRMKSPRKTKMNLAPHKLIYLSVSTLVLIALGFIIYTILSQRQTETSILATIVIKVLAFGFPLTIVLSWFYDIISRRFKRTRPVENIQKDKVAAMPITWKIATFASFVVIIGLFAVNVFRRGDINRNSNIQRVLILPFANLTGIDSLEYFVSGMHASLITEMGRISGLDVINRTTSNLYKNVDKPLHEIAKELNVDAVIETDILSLGDSICSEHRMIRGSSDEELFWMGDYKEDKSKILNLYNNITRQIVDEVKIELTPTQKRLLTQSRTVDPNAYEAYMKGQFYLNRFTPDALDSAILYFQLAKEIDPGYALAYTGICDVWGYRMQWGLVSSAEGNPKSMEALMRAYALDSNNAVVQYSLAIKRTWGMFDWDGGEAGFIKSLSLNPSNALTHAVYSHLLNILGRPDEALEQIDIALELDPMNPFIMTFNGVDLYMARKYEESIKAFNDALSLEPEYPFALANLWQSYYMVGRIEEAYATLKSWSMVPESVKALEQGYLRDGVKGAFLSLADRLGIIWTDNQNQFFAPTDIAMLYSAGHETDKSIYWLEQAYKFRDPNLPYLLNPIYDNVRNDPRFQDLEDRINLSD